MEKLNLNQLQIAFNMKTNTSITSKIIEYLDENYDFRCNIVTGRNEWKFKKGSEYTDLEHRHLCSIWRNLDMNGIGSNTDITDKIICSDYVKEFDPFLDYFKELKWDGETDYISQLADTVTTTNTDFWKKAFKKWIVAVVACSTGVKENHHAIVLSGAQGKGKTTWLTELLPKKLAKYMYSGSINPHSKDTLINFAETLLINLDELENLTRLELGNLKEVITKRTIRQRRPYEKYHKTFYRRTSFMGSVNDAEFLTDTTGNRRYLCFYVEKIAKHEIDMDNVFAQAYHLLLKGENNEQFKYWFDENDIAEIEENNSQFVRVSIEEELIRKYFEVPKSAEGESFMTPTDIMYHINRHEGMMMLDKSSLKRLGQALQKLGFSKKSTVDSKPYRLILKQVVKKDFVFKPAA